MPQHKKKQQGTDTKNKPDNKLKNSKIKPTQASSITSPESSRQKGISKTQDPVKDEVIYKTSNLIITDDSNKKFSKREISSNWAKYEEPIDPYKDVDSDYKAADFQTLLQMPTSKGGHFQFKNEKFEQFKREDTTHFDYFRSKPAIVASALASVPFYIRNDLDKSLFTDAEIHQMNDRAKISRQKFNTLVRNENRPQDKFKMGVKVKEPLERSFDSLLVLNVQQKENVSEESKDISHEVPPETVNTNAPNQAVDLDKWLDDFLDT